MKIRNLFFYVSAAAALMLTTQCEGPAGADGQDGTATCLQCHAEDQIITVQVQFKQSAHKGGLIAVDYAGGRESCAKCHSHEGFVEFATFGKVDGNIVAPSPWECSTCHGLHTAFDTTDYTLRLAAPVKLIADTNIVVDYGKGNLCANCHQARANEPNSVSPGETFKISSSHYGPHYGTQANLLYGATFAEISGSKSYPADGSHPHASVGCTGCHMGEYADGAGGHTYNPNIDHCKVCHTSIGDDFDYNDVQTEVEEKLVVIRDLLVEQGVLEIHYEIEEGDTIAVEYEPVVDTHSMKQAQAFFNWKGIYKDRSLGVHNPTYINALLDNTIEALK